MKIKFKIECKVVQLGEILNLLKSVASHCAENSLDDLGYANWIYNIKGLHDLIFKKKIQHISSNANKKVSFKIDLTQFVLFGEAYQDLNMVVSPDPYYSTIFNTIINEPCLKQFEQFKTALK